MRVIRGPEQLDIGDRLSGDSFVGYAVDELTERSSGRFLHHGGRQGHSGAWGVWGYDIGTRFFLLRLLVELMALTTNIITKTSFPKIAHGWALLSRECVFTGASRELY